MPRNRLHPRPDGFTLIELLAVIAILGILTGLLFVAFKGISGTAGAQATNVLLGNAKGLLAEYELTQRLSDLDSNLDPSSNGPPGDFPLQTINSIDYYQEEAPGLVTAEGGADRYSGGSNRAVFRTQIVMGRLLAVPANRKAIGSIPSDALLGPPTGTSTLVLQGGALKPPVLLDSYKNPILYVPAGGLVGVKFGPRTSPDTRPLMRVTSRGVVANDAAPPAGNRPFFATAGKDGDFTEGDDNVYSFSN